MKKVIKNLSGTILAIMFLTLLIIACNKSSNVPGANAKSLSVFLTDDPAQFNDVFIDIRTVEVKVDEDVSHDSHFADNDIDKNDDHKDHDQFGKWDTLSIRPGVYNIMNFRNGIDTLLAAGSIPVGRIGKIRITLGTNNSVVVLNVSHPLLLPAGQNNYVYVKVEDDDLDNISADRLTLFIDFDLSASIQEVQGQFFLKPFIKPFGKEKFGQIKGAVTPKDANAIIKVYKGSDTATAIPDNGNGNFKIRGLKEGNYSILFRASNGYKDSTINNVQIQMGKETEIPKVTLHK